MPECQSSPFTHSSSTGELTALRAGVCTVFKVLGVPDLRGGTNVLFTHGEATEPRLERGGGDGMRDR